MATSQVVEADRRQLGGPQERLKLASRDVPAAEPPVGAMTPASPQIPSLLVSCGEKVPPVGERP